ncbi:bacterial translation initiation factor 3 (bIF-3) [Balnearium lithotrophicum]|uniref:Translation initiation factor IF-3 n=1 Tax=Balnearium lithotrophicum TaxID=223788 RepID=A0A521BR05_9BACT|nr:translation initiation factor IF-3 [Balnearium lithotrophicum]SMO49543.1 bacterial translation initiation factor 3 (bIF-3) [Balnearium lithotrophicum]
MNEKIRAREVLVIDENGQKLGVMPTREALNLARERGLDLVEVSPNANPPVCRIMDFGKYKYQMQKKMHEAKKRQKTIEVKTVKIRPRTDEHDMQVRIKQVRKFLEKGNKVKAIVMFRGREQAHVDLGEAQLLKIYDAVKDIAEMERKPKKEGRDMIMILAPKKN